MQQKLGFTKGMRRGLSPENYGDESYFEATNKQIIFDEGSLTASITDERGNLQLSDIDGVIDGDTLIKVFSVRDWLVSFTKTSANKYKIKRFKIDSTNQTVSKGDVYINTGLSTSVMSDNIQAVFRYRDEDFCKMYWVSDIGQIRSLNIFVDNSSTSVEMLNAFPPITLSEPKITSVEIGGILPCGKYQYAYQLFNIDGGETVFSQPSFPVSIGAGSLSGQSNEFLGGLEGEISSKSCKVTIDSLDNRYQNIRVVSIYYKDDVSIPDIRVVTESKLGSATFTFTDTGAITLDVYTPEEFNFIGGRIFTAKTLTAKDNYLIAGNIEEEYFDIDDELGEYWDARAYRHQVSSNNFMVDSTAYTDFTAVPEEANCILTKQNQSDNHKFKRNSTKLGGTGTNVSYEFFIKSIAIDNPITAAEETIKTFGVGNTSGEQVWSSSIDSGFSDNPYYKNFASPINAGQLAGYQRNEIYRFGILFVKDGRHSFVKWIGDIKFPAINGVTVDGVTFDDTNGAGNTTYTIEGSPQIDFNTFYRESNGIMYANILGIKFTVANVPSGYKWQIVRAPRTEADKTVLTQGISTYNTNTNNNGTESLNRFLKPSTDSYINNAAVDKHTISFNSPEINYNKLTIGKYQNDKLVFQKTYSYAYWEEAKIIDPSADITFGNICAVTFSKAGYNLDVVLVSSGNNFSFVKDTIKVSPMQKAYVDSYGQTALSNTFNIVDNDGVDYAANGGVTQYISLNSVFTKASGTLSPNTFAVFNYEREKDSAIYGGNTYSARTIATYIKCGSLETGNGSTPVTSNVLLGDTYLNFFEFLHLGYASGKITNRTSWSSTVYVPLESSINLDMVNGFLRSKRYMARELYLLQETNEFGKSILPVEAANAVLESEQGVSKYLNSYGDMYQYNKAYSREVDAKKYFPKPLNFRALDKHYNKIINSEVYNGASLSDPWTKFMYVSEITLDGQYGNITKLLDFNNKLIAFQDTAIAVVGFNDKEVMQSNSSTALTLGTGDRLTYYQYLTKSSGTQYAQSILDTGNGLYYLDNINKKLMTFQENGVVALSDLGECTDLFEPLIFTAGRVVSGYDKIKRRIYYTIGQELTISFNEKLGAFESKHSYYPNEYFNYNNGLYAIPISKLHMWKQGAGNALSFFGSSPTGSIKLLFNGGKESFKYKKVFNNLEFQARVKKADGSIETISTQATLPISVIALATGYQTNSTSITSGTTNLKNKFYTWRYQLPRDSSLRRFMDYYLFVTITNSNVGTATNLLTIDDVSIHYLIPMI